MNRSIAFFNVDTQQPSEDGRSLVFRPRVEPIRPALESLLAFAERAGIVTLATACVNAGPLRHLLGPDALFVSLDADAGPRPDDLRSRRLIWLEKRSCGSPELNRQYRAFDVFTANPHIPDVLARLSIPHYAVFGDAVGYCVRSTAEGLLRRGFRVTLLSDAVANGVDTDEVRGQVLADLSARGARLMTTSDLIWELSR